MKIYKYIAIGAVATFAWSAAQAEEKGHDSYKSINANLNAGFNENSGSVETGAGGSREWTDESGGLNASFDENQGSRTWSES